MREERHSACLPEKHLEILMKIDYSKIEEKKEINFKGGNGELVTRNFVH